MIVPLKYLSKFWRTLETPLINMKLKLFQFGSGNVAAETTKFEITDAKKFVPVVILSIQDNAKLLQQLKSSFKEQLTGTNINQK